MFAQDDARQLRSDLERVLVEHSTRERADKAEPMTCIASIVVDM